MGGGSSSRRQTAARRRAAAAAGHHRGSELDLAIGFGICGMSSDGMMPMDSACTAHSSRARGLSADAMRQLLLLVVERSRQQTSHAFVPTVSWFDAPRKVHVLLLVVAEQP